MPIACHLNVIIRDAKTPRHLANLVEGERSVQRLSKQLLGVLVFAFAIGSHKLFRSLAILGTREIPQEDASPFPSEAYGDPQPDLRLVQVMQQAVADHRVGHLIVVHLHLLHRRMVEVDLSEAARDVNFAFGQFQHFDFPVNGNHLKDRVSLAQFDWDSGRSTAQVDHAGAGRTLQQVVHELSIDGIVIHRVVFRRFLAGSERLWFGDSLHDAADMSGRGCNLGACYDELELWANEEARPALRIESTFPNLRASLLDPRCDLGGGLGIRQSMEAQRLFLTKAWLEDTKAWLEDTTAWFEDAEASEEDYVARDSYGSNFD